MKTIGTDNSQVVLTEHPFDGLKDGEERLAKAEIARLINRLVLERGLKQKEAAQLLAITQPEVSQLANGRLSGFSFDRLYRCLQRLGIDVEIALSEPSTSAGKSGCLRVRI